MIGGRGPDARDQVFRSVIGFLVLASAGCSSYSDFTLPLLPGGDPHLTFTFDPLPAPVLSDLPYEALNPSVVRRGPTLLNLYSVFDGARWRTELASSEDGLRWRKDRPVLLPDPQTWEGSYIAANGSALLVNNQVWYWYEAAEQNRIGLARDFQRLPRPVLEPGPYMSWDERAVADPDVIRIGPWFYLYYLGQDRAVPHRQRIGLARSGDGIHWEKLRSNPILELGEPGAFDENGLGEPAVFEFRGFYWMLYTGRDAQENRRFGLARSTDGVHWRKLPAVFSGDARWDSQVVCDASVLVENSEIRVWFGGGDARQPEKGLHGQIGYGVLRPIWQ